MPSPFFGINEAFPTAATPVPVVVCVFGDDVPRHGRIRRKPGRTEGADVRPLSRVGPVVYNEVRPFRESGRAHLTPIGLHFITGL